MENGRVITPYGTGRVIKNPEVGGPERFIVELDKIFKWDKERVVFRSEIQFIKDFANLFVIDLSAVDKPEIAQPKARDNQLVSYAQLIETLKPNYHYPQNFIHFELALKQKEFRVKPSLYRLSQRFLHVYGWLDRAWFMRNEHIPSDKSILEIESYFVEFKRKRFFDQNVAYYLEAVLDLKEGKILKQWFLTHNGVFELD